MAQIRLGEALVQAGLIDEYQLKSALGQQRRWGGRLGKALIDLGFIDETTLLSFLSERLKFSAVDLSRSKIAPKTFAAVPKRIAEKYMVVPVLIKDTPGKKTLVLAMADPTDLKAIDEIEFLTNYRIEPVVALESSIQKVLKRYGMPDEEKKEEEIGVALEDIPKGRVEIVHGDLDQMIEVQKQYEQKSTPSPSSPPPRENAEVAIKEKFDFSATAEEGGEWLGEKEEEAHEEPDKLEFTPTSEDEISEEAEVIQEAEPIEEVEAVEEVSNETPPDEGEVSAEVRIAQTIEDAAQFYARQQSIPPQTTATAEAREAEEAADTIEEAEVCEPCDEEVREEPLSGGYVTEGETEAASLAETATEEEPAEEVYAAEPIEEPTDSYEYEPAAEAGAVEEGEDADIAAEAVEEAAEYEDEDTAAEMVAEAVSEEEEVYEAQPVEAQAEEYAEEVAEPVVEAVAEEAAESPVIQELRLLRAEISDLKKQIEGLIMLFVLKEEGKISLKDFLKEIKNL